LSDPFVVLTEPALLAGMPRSAVVKGLADLHAAGYRHVVRLEDQFDAYDAAPLRLAEFPLQDLWRGALPEDPDAERAMVARAAEHVLAKLALGDGVVVHCIGGIGRTGTVLGCVLVRLGRDPDEVIAMLDAQHGGWPEAPFQSECVRGARAWPSSAQ
jgi:hypothetical protein